MIDYKALAKEEEKKRKEIERLKKKELIKKEKERKRKRNKREREKRRIARKEREKEKAKLEREKEREKIRIKREKEKLKEREKNRILKEKEKDRKEKLKERERIRKEKKRIERRILMKKKNNHDYYVKTRKKYFDERFKNGDVYARHCVVIMKNNKKIKKLGVKKWKSDAYALYNECIEKNKKEVVYPVKIEEVMNECSYNDIKYEIMIVQETDNENNIARFRNDDGMFVDNVIVDKPNWVIIAKHEWLVEETFAVYGFHPKRERKTYSFIKNEIVSKNICRNNVKRIFLYANKLIIQYDLDFDFVSCKTEKEAERLYNALFHDFEKEKYVIFTGKLSRFSHGDFIDKIQAKTGWDRNACKRPDLL